MLRNSILAFTAAAVIAGAWFAPTVASAAWYGSHWDRDVRADQRDVRRDRFDLRGDRLELRRDWRDFGRDLRYGSRRDLVEDYAEIRGDRRDVHHDWWRLHRARRDLFLDRHGY